MIRLPLRSSRRFTYKPSRAIAVRQWLAARTHMVVATQQRGFADNRKPGITDSKPIVLPGSASKATTEPLPPGAVATSLSSSVAHTSTTPSAGSTIPSQKIPLTPPTPPISPLGRVDSTKSSSVNTPSPTPPKLPLSPPQKSRRWGRRIITTLFLLTMLGYGGGVYYSRLNDNFHDFFTEYIPFGEDAVLYLEEREFRRRYHSKATRGKPPRDTGDQIKIPSQSGVSWRVTDDKSSGRHSSAIKGDASKPGEAARNPLEANKGDKLSAVERAKAQATTPYTKPSPAPGPKSAPETTSIPQPKPAQTVTKESESSRESVPAGFKAPEVNEPSRYPPKITRVDPINIEDAKEPVVQDLVKIINNIITVVNADNADGRFSTTIGKAKSELRKVGNKIKTLKDAVQKEADQKVKEAHEEFDRGAKQLIQRISEEVEAQELTFKHEYESERRRIQENYERKLKSEIDQIEKVNKQRLRNELLEQAVAMKKSFTTEVKARVDEERNGRLSKLSDLTNNLTELEKLTTDWNSVIDTNLKTQHLHVAVEAVRSNLEKSEIPRPFVRELAALKEIASEDSLVDAAIASINPTAYQRGIPSPAQLIDRFRRVASEVRKASLLPEGAGVASHVSSFVLSKFLFQKKGVAMGDDVESVLTRTETFLEEGDLDAAAREMNALKGWAKTLSGDWLGELRRVLEVRQALDVITIEARLQSLRVGRASDRPKKGVHFVQLTTQS